ncbi:MAG: leucine-rich repeat domain-containing protein [Anaerostipes sp.]|nr:leucine-rich repeat domain-containing protein [Anaerostipes sp.]
MKRFKKVIKIGSLFMALSMAICLISGPVYAGENEKISTGDGNEKSKKVSTIDSGKCGDNITWSLDSDYKLILDGTGATWGWRGADSSDYAPWYSYHDDIKTIVIGSGITKLGDGLFYGCKNAKRVNIGPDVEFIGDYIFSHCNNLLEITFPSKLKHIGEQAFWECVELTTLNFPDSLTEINDEAFVYCVKLETVSFGEKLETIPRKAFYGCVSLRNVSWPKELKNIETQAFYCCFNMAGVSLPEGLATMGDEVFSMDPGTDENLIVYKKAGGPEYLTYVNLPDSLSKMGANIFKDCTGLTEVDFSSGMTLIPQRTFYGCTSLKEINIPDSIKTINYAAFSGCSSLTSVQGTKYLESIESEAFYDCSGLKKLYFPNAEMRIASDAFQNAGSPETVVAGKYGSTAQELAESKDWKFDIIKEDQKITATSSYTKVIGSKEFNLQAKTSGNGKLTYSSNKKGVATVTSSGNVAIKGYGKAIITIKAASTSRYNSAKKTVIVKVVPKKAVIKSISPKSGKKLQIKWSVASSVTGYQIYLSRSKDFETDTKARIYSRKNSGNVTISKLEKGTYYIKIRAYKTVDDVRYYGAWSATKSVKIK